MHQLLSQPLQLHFGWLIQGHLQYGELGSHHPQTSSEALPSQARSFCRALPSPSTSHSPEAHSHCFFLQTPCLPPLCFPGLALGGSYSWTPSFRLGESGAPGEAQRPERPPSWVDRSLAQVGPPLPAPGRLGRLGCWLWCRRPEWGLRRDMWGVQGQECSLHSALGNMPQGGRQGAVGIHKPGKKGKQVGTRLASPSTPEEGPRFDKDLPSTVTLAQLPPRLVGEDGVQGGASRADLGLTCLSGRRAVGPRPPSSSANMLVSESISASRLPGRTPPLSPLSGGSPWDRGKGVKVSCACSPLWPWAFPPLAS